MDSVWWYNDKTYAGRCWLARTLEHGVKLVWLDELFECIALKFNRVL
jgi:hypothetical protein